MSCVRLSWLYAIHYKSLHIISHALSKVDHPRGHFRSRDKDGGHTIWSAISKNPMLHANFVGLCFIERELLPIAVLHYGNRTFWPFLYPVMLTRWPSYTNEIRICWKYIASANMNFIRQGFQKLSSGRQTYRQTDRQDQNYTPRPRRFASGQ